jgi:hypothetical protein
MNVYVECRDRQLVGRKRQAQVLLREGAFGAANGLGALSHKPFMDMNGYQSTLVIVYV